VDDHAYLGSRIRNGGGAPLMDGMVDALQTRLTLSLVLRRRLAIIDISTKLPFKITEKPGRRPADKKGACRKWTERDVASFMSAS
jgi:hypothetical protein